MKLFVTEKPSVAMEYADYLNIPKDNRKNGFLEGYSDILDSNIVITWAIGHLVMMSYPEAYDDSLKEWQLETLPFLPDRYIYEVIDEVKNQFYIIRKLYHRQDLDCIYYCGDSAREGIYIQSTIRMLAGRKEGIDERVVWIHSITRDEVLRGIKTAKAYSSYQNLIWSGYARAIEDYALGINFSRLLTLKYKTEFIKSGGEVLSVGRVMTCVLGLVHEREDSIKNFVKEKWYKVFDTKYKAEWVNKAKTKEEAENIVNKLNQAGELKVVKKTDEEEEKKAPLLFNLTDLQSECVAKFKISPEKTLEIAQELYEEKLITYPRTDARVLSSAVAGEITKNIKGLEKLYPAAVSTILDNRLYEKIDKYINDKKINDHYAIIPTGEYKDIIGLKQEVYDLIVKRFLAIFYPAAVYKKTEILLKTLDEDFIYKKKTLIFAGYLGLYPDVLTNRESEDNIGDSYKTTFSFEEKETQPQKKFTTGSILLDMEKAGGIGLGTPATRADILNKLKEKGYIAVNRSQIISLTDIGEATIKIVKHSIPELLNVNLTVKWEAGLLRIEKGEIRYNDYIALLNRYIEETVERVKKSEVIDMGIKGSICPICKKGVVHKNSVGGYGCSLYKEGCTFYIGRIAGKELSIDTVAELIKGKVVGPIKGFKTKDGKEFSSKLMLNEEGKVIFCNEKKLTDFICPKCKNKLEETKYSYKCECGFSIWHTISQKKIPKTEMLKILKGESTGLIKGFKGKDGKTFDAALKWNGEKYEFEFPKRG